MSEQRLRAGVRVTLVNLTIVVLLVAPLAAGDQAPAKVPRIGQSLLSRADEVIRVTSRDDRHPQNDGRSDTLPRLNRVLATGASRRSEWLVVAPLMAPGRLARRAPSCFSAPTGSHEETS